MFSNKLKKLGEKNQLTLYKIKVCEITKVDFLTRNCYKKITNMIKTAVRLLKIRSLC